MSGSPCNWLDGTTLLFDLLQVSRESRRWTPFEVRICFVEVVRACVPRTRLLRGKYDVNCVELVWFGKCGDPHGASSVQSDDNLN